MRIILNIDVNPGVFRKHYADALRAIPGVRPLSPHCCRHTYVSRLQAKGVDIETIKNLSGHADPDMTQHYLHVQREIKERAADRLNQVFSAAYAANNLAPEPLTSCMTFKRAPGSDNYLPP